MKAKDCLEPGETGLAALTDGKHFIEKPDRTGSTAFWILKASREFDKVIIYLRKTSPKVNEIHVARYKDKRRNRANGKFTIYFENINHIEDTKFNWTEFVEGSRNPVRILKK